MIPTIPTERSCDTNSLTLTLANRLLKQQSTKRWNFPGISCWQKVFEPQGRHEGTLSPRKMFSFQISMQETMESPQGSVMSRVPFGPDSLVMQSSEPLARTWRCTWGRAGVLYISSHGGKSPFLGFSLSAWLTEGWLSLACQLYQLIGSDPNWSNNSLSSHPFSSKKCKPGYTSI